jgi:hypothetical protein
MEKENGLKNPHVVISSLTDPAEIVCNICGERQKLPEGAMRIEIFTAVTKAFIKIHSRCKNKKNLKEVLS